MFFLEKNVNVYVIERLILCFCIQFDLNLFSMLKYKKPIKIKNSLKYNVKKL